MVVLLGGGSHFWGPAVHPSSQQQQQQPPMRPAKFRALSMAASEPDEGDASIVWESPDRPANANDYIFTHVRGWVTFLCTTMMDGEDPLKSVRSIVAWRIDAGKRMVRPYYFEFLSHVKKRWEGSTVVEVFAQEFKGRPLEYYIQAVQGGRILVEGRRVAPSYVLRDSQKMSHFVHRHEPPVLAGPVKILEEGPDVITVCKPPSVPVHPCGQYRKNTVVGILEAEHKTGKLFPVHRLDRLVSGLLILARSAKTANLFRQEIEAGRVQKQYVAKVKGVFPAHEVVVNAAVIYDAREGVSSVETGKLGTGKGKGACTRFQRLSTNGQCSVVRCEPVTGRTHQIRVHLQHLGHPIANDDLYAEVHPPKRSREGVSADTASKAARTLAPSTSSGGHLESSLGGSGNNAGSPLGGVTRSQEPGNLVVGDTLPELEAASSPPFCVDLGRNTYLCHGKSEEPATVSRNSFQAQDFSASGSGLDANGCFRPAGFGNCSTESVIASRESDLHTTRFTQVNDTDETESVGHPFSVDLMCTQCPNLGPLGYKYDEEGLWLHCVSYKCPSWAYECPLPDWAL